MKVYHYLLKPLTNLHVGSGDSHYGVIDNLVQRDVSTGLPTIHASSLKGALREFCEHHMDDGDAITDIFGADSRQANHVAKAGQCKFLPADLLSRPLRSDKTAYFHATDTEVIARFAQKCEDFGVKAPEKLPDWRSILTPTDNCPLVFEKQYDEAIAEEMDWQASFCDLQVGDEIKSLWGDQPMVMTAENFKQLDLPVIARNNLENGISKNLWYEEVVPSDSRFTFMVIGPDDLMKILNQKITETTVQIGANASVGYGFCKITLLNG